MQTKQSISVFLKLMLPAFLMIGCNSKEGTSEKVGYLTANVNGEGLEVSQFNGTVVSEKRPAGSGVVNLEVKVESDKGETVEFMILDYQENIIYTLQKATIEHFPIVESSGSSRYCVHGRFFWESKIPLSVWYSGKKDGYTF